MEFVYRSEKIKIVLVLISIVMVAYCVDETEMEIKSLDWVECVLLKPWVTYDNTGSNQS